MIQCDWCRAQSNQIPEDKLCPDCGHRLDQSRASCECVKCIDGRKWAKERMYGIGQEPVYKNN